MDLKASLVGSGATTILAELEERSAALGSPPSECSRQRSSEAGLRVVAAYLKNNTDRMRYDDYRRQGLPIMTSMVESAIKMMNKRVKGATEVLVGAGRGGRSLQLRADHLSETEAMNQFWEAREAQTSSGRVYRLAS